MLQIRIGLDPAVEALGKEHGTEVHIEMMRLSLSGSGWFSVSLDRHLQATISHVKYQLARLWHPDTIRLLTAYLQVYWNFNYFALVSLKYCMYRGTGT